jgi:ABC-2 type transport system permease protein
MSILRTAKMDAKITFKTITPWAAVVALTLFTAVLSYAHTSPQKTAKMSFVDAFQLNAILLGVSLPLIAILACHDSIAGERENNGIKVYLSLPNTRLDIYLGKLLSRLAVILVAVVVATCVIAAITYGKYSVFPIRLVLGFTLLMGVYAVVFSSLTVAVSATHSSQQRTISSMIAIYFFTVFIQLLPFAHYSDLVQFVHHDLLGMEKNPDLYNFADFVNPFVAYQKAVNGIFPDQSTGNLFLDSARNVDTSTGQSTPDVGQELPANLELPIYLTDEFSIVILSLWIVIPLALGYWKYKQADLA